MTGPFLSTSSGAALMDSLSPLTIPCSGCKAYLGGREWCSEHRKCERQQQEDATGVHGWNSWVEVGQRTQCVQEIKRYMKFRRGGTQSVRR
ncbi:uncharacterized protein EKO05_0005942 [Ascochyta rabiei]|uniref:uncharacterized protein n=1 Tax=Didymella rabiei TaxID=5454 RepID=UPI0022035121|nr:uncharacterized protein EKO05_0005942 [Ascochyta rabiei]UPX15496.1 hypothetical protein EKO05_0005942 [Ascochyta rabiei]